MNAVPVRIFSMSAASRLHTSSDHSLHIFPAMVAKVPFFVIPPKRAAGQEKESKTRLTKGHDQKLTNGLALAGS